MSALEKAAELDPVVVGAEIGAELWRGRAVGVGANDALAWVRGSRATQRAADTDENAIEPADLLAAVVPSDGSGQPIGGVLEVVARDLRLVLSWLDGAKITRRGSGYEPKDDDVFGVILDAERRVSVAIRAVRLESDSALLAIHAAAHGAFAEAERAPSERAPSDFREHVPPTTLERVGRALGADADDVAAAGAVARAWGLGELREARAERLLIGLGRLRADLDTEPTAPTTGGSMGGACEPGRRGTFWGHWRMRSSRGSAVAS